MKGITSTCVDDTVSDNIGFCKVGSFKRTGCKRGEADVSMTIATMSAVSIRDGAMYKLRGCTLSDSND